jgi:DNA-binding HxlR family transcriptional regulator
MEDGTSTSVRHTDVCQTSSCEIRDLLDRLADKWSLLVIELLGTGSRRFTELHREIGQISHRMLTVTLRHLERDGLLTRTVHPVVPPRVDYELTALGKGLLVTIEGLVSWTRAHKNEIASARSDYDLRHARVPRHTSPAVLCD